MTYAKRIAYNTIIQFAGRLVMMVVSLATVGILNSGLLAEGWGRYASVIAYQGFFAVLADMGVNVLFLRDISRDSERTEELTATYMGFRITTAALIFISAPLIASFLPVYHNLINFIWIASIAQFFLVLNQIYVSVFQARLIMDRAVIGDFMGRVLILIATILCFRYLPASNRLNGALWSVALGSLLNLFITIFLVRKLIKIKVAFRFKEWPSLLLRVLPMGAMTVLGMIHFKADSFILAIFKSAIDVGIYANAYKIVEILLNLPGMFVGSLFPKMNQALSAKDPSFADFVQKAFDILLFVALPIIFIVASSAPYIIGILTRNYVLSSAHSLQILTLAMLPWFLGNLFGNILLAADRQKVLCVVELIAAALNIGLNIYFIRRWSFIGAATTTVITEALMTITTWRLLVHYLGLKVNLKALRGLLPGLVILVLYCLVLVLPNSASDLLHNYFSWGRMPQIGVMGVWGVLAIAAYTVPILLWGTFPPVLQSKLQKYLSNRLKSDG